MKKRHMCCWGRLLGKNHIKTLHQLDSLKGVVEINEIALSSLSKSYPEIRLHKSIIEALCEDYDGYVIATPAKTHYEIAKKVINSQKPF